MEEINISPNSKLYMPWHTLRRIKAQADDGISLLRETLSQEKQELSEEEDEVLREIVRRIHDDSSHLYEELKYSGAREVINRYRFDD